MDILIKKINTGFETSTYRKPTATGLGLKFESAVSSIYKSNLVDCLIDRAYKVNYNYKNLCIEFNKLRKVFCQNRFGIRLTDE